MTASFVQNFWVSGVLFAGITSDWRIVMWLAAWCVAGGAGVVAC